MLWCSGEGQADDQSAPTIHGDFDRSMLRMIPLPSGRIIAAIGVDIVTAKPRQRKVELPLVILDHSDWDELIRTIREVVPNELWITHGREDEALVHAPSNQGARAQPGGL